MDDEKIVGFTVSHNKLCTDMYGSKCAMKRPTMMKLFLCFQKYAYNFIFQVYMLRDDQVGLGEAHMYTAGVEGSLVGLDLETEVVPEPELVEAIPTPQIVGSPVLQGFNTIRVMEPGLDRQSKMRGHAFYGGPGFGPGYDSLL